MSSKTLLPWLKLVRLPAVFTALADIFAGFLLTRTSWTPLPQFFCLLGASAGLYLSGMVFNDVFDIQQDRVERPQRPIPAGHVNLKSAAIFAVVLMLIGLGLAFLAGLHSLLVAVVLAIAILVYDGILKRTPLGPLSMGLCRFLNILLGASSAATHVTDLWGMPQIWVAVAMGLYITGVTWFARAEARTSPRASLLGGLIVLDVGLCLLALWILDFPNRWGLASGPVGTDDAIPMLLFWGIITVSLNRRAIGAIYDPIPSSVQPAIGSMLLSVVTLDAMTIYFRLGPAGLSFALATLGLLIPAILTKRWISMT